MKTLPLSLTALCSIICYFASAQIKNSTYEIGINAGAGLYTGDLTPTLLSPYKSPGFFLGFNGSKKLNNSFSLQADISFGKVKADDANYTHPEYRQQRNYNFSTRVTELSAALAWYPLGSGRRITPWISAGAGLSFVKIKRDYSNLNPEYFINDPSISEGLPEDIAHRLPRIIPVVPLATGIRFSITQKFSLNMLTAYRLMSTDYLDGFSKGANPSKKDYYYTHSIGIIYSFGSKNTLACPK